ncbi:MAG: glycoside hydrolase family 3 protein [Chloroflexi bacterium]|nr:glycoside hydrolase family 3 protein [Chloroflexota bacterium]
MTTRREGAAALDLAGCRVLRTFVGLEPTPEVLAAIQRGDASGVTLFRHKNVGSPEQLRELCARLQDARPAGDPPLIIGLDQEGGQLQAVGDPATAWPGNLALGATGSAALAEATGRAIGLEAAALGANLVFAPVCDVLQPASASPLGTRPFGSDPALVGRLAAAMVRGLQGASVAAVLKHFPGHGSAVGDSHAAMPVVRDDAATVRARDLAPFRDGIAAGVKAVLPGHLAVPALTDGEPIAATVSRQLLGALLRGELGFGGVTISDALDMGGAGTAGHLDAQALAAVAAGMDLLLLVHPATLEDSVVDAIRTARAGGALDPADATAARARIHALRTWLGEIEQPGLEVVGCKAHLALARRIAEASVTLVRDPAGLLPVLAAGAGSRIALVAPVPVDLTPAETSSYVQLGLADALRRRGLDVSEIVAPLDPTAGQVAALLDASRDADLVLVATFDAVSHPGQAALARAFAATARPAIAIALRSPYDVALFGPALTAICTYGIQAPQMDALAAGLVGEIRFAGRPPVNLAAGS